MVDPTLCMHLHSLLGRVRSETWWCQDWMSIGRGEVVQSSTKRCEHLVNLDSPFWAPCCSAQRRGLYCSKESVGNKKMQVIRVTGKWFARLLHPWIHCTLQRIEPTCLEADSEVLCALAGYDHVGARVVQ